MTHMWEERHKGAVKEAEKERALKEVSKANLQDQGAVMEVVEMRATEVERARAAAEKKAADLEGKLGEAKMRLA